MVGHLTDQLPRQRFLTTISMSRGPWILELSSMCLKLIFLHLLFYNFPFLFRSKLNDMFYTKNQQVIDDIRLVFNNCYSVREKLVFVEKIFIYISCLFQYNMEDAEEYECAERLEKYFDNQLKSHGLISEESSNPRSKKRRF